MEDAETREPSESRLKAKKTLSLYIYAILAIFGLTIVVINSVLITKLETAHFNDELKQKISDVLSTLSPGVSQAMVNDDRQTVRAVLDGVLKNVGSVHRIRVTNHSNELIGDVVRPQVGSEIELVTGSRRLEVAEQFLGELTIEWDRTRTDSQIKEHRFDVLKYVIGTLVAIGLVLVFALQRIVIRPLDFIHKQVTTLASKDHHKAERCPSLPVREIDAISHAINRLQDYIKYRINRRSEQRENDERFQEAMETAIQGVIVHNHFDPLFINSACANIFGYTSPSEMMNVETVKGLIAPDALSHLSEQIDSLVNLGIQSASLELEGCHKEGHPVWLDTRVRKITWAGREAILLTIVDISDRIIAQRNALNAEQQLISAIEALPDGFVLYDADDRLVICNDKYRNLYKETADAIKPGVLFEDIIRAGLDKGQYPEAIGREEQWLEERLRHHHSLDGSIEQKTASGKWLRIDERKTPSGGVVGFRIDITELKEREISLWESGQRFRATVDTALDCIVGMDKEGRVVEFNPAAESTFGYTKSEAIGREMAELIIPERYQQLHREGIKKFFETGEGAVIGKRIEIEAVRKNGEEFPVELAISVSQETDGAIFVGYIRDITERRTAEANLKEARDKAEVANRAKSEFLAMMSHEIRTPLNGVLGVLGLLHDAKLEDQQANYVTTGRRAAEGLLDVINDILDFSKMEAGHLDFEAVIFSPEGIAQDVLDVVTTRAVENETELELIIAPGLVKQVSGDSSRIRQVLLNLVGNAVKFSGKGKVIVKLSSGPEINGEVEIKAEVIDNGVGIASDQHARLFSEFTTLSPTYQQKFQGTGLGLAICKRLITAMGGTIDFTSEPGKGSTFWFEVKLPVATEVEIKEFEAELQLEKDRGDINDLRFTGGRLLLAEDNPANQLVARTMLENAGFEVDLAATGIEAVEAATARIYDLILMDIGMPDMDGIAATAEIRKLTKGRGDVPIIAMTAHVMQGDRESIMSQGIDDYLSKPVRKTVLLASLARWLRPFLQAPNATASSFSAVDLEQDVPGSVSNSAIDTKALAQLGEDTGVELLPMLIETFIDNAEERIAAIAVAVDKGDLAAVEHEAHALKSSAATFGATGLHRLTIDLELAGSNEDAKQIEDLAPALAHEGEAAIEQLRDYLGKLAE